MNPFVRDPPETDATEVISLFFSASTRYIKAPAANSAARCPPPDMATPIRAIVRPSFIDATTYEVLDSFLGGAAAYRKFASLLRRSNQKGAPRLRAATVMASPSSFRAHCPPL